MYLKIRFKFFKVMNEKYILRERFSLNLTWRKCITDIFKFMIFFNEEISKDENWGWIVNEDENKTFLFKGSKIIKIYIHQKYYHGKCNVHLSQRIRKNCEINFFVITNEKIIQKRTNFLKIFLIIMQHGIIFYCFNSFITMLCLAHSCYSKEYTPCIPQCKHISSKFKQVHIHIKRHHMMK